MDDGTTYNIHGVTLSRIGERFLVLTFPDGSEAALARQHGDTIADKPPAGTRSDAADFLRRYHHIDGATLSRRDDEILSLCEKMLSK